jgi:hypothetical protein
MIREKKIKSGRLLEVEFYPVLSDGRQLARSPKQKRSSEAQAAYNKKQQRKKVVRLVNANFDKSDVLMTLTLIPDDDGGEKQAKKKIVNFLRRVKRYREKKVKEWTELLRLKPQSKKVKENLKKASEPLKYIYAVESGIYQRGKRKGMRRYHFHLFLTGCGEGDRDAYESLWDGRTNADRYRPETFGPEAAAKYLTKQHKVDEDGGTVKSQGYVCSRNLKRPEEKTKDGKVSEHKLDLMARKRIDDAAYWERLYKGYKLVRCYARWNEYNAHWYISAVMYRSDSDPPPWSIEDW